jgi:sn-glycerol 3-phosphate transport system substrate-binding protein
MLPNGSNTDGKTYSRRKLLKAGGAAAVVGLAGCAGESDETGDTTTEASGTTTAGTVEDQAVTISFWPAWGGYYEETFNTMVSNFEAEYPDITVDMSAQGSYTESRTALFNAANAGNAPDIGHIDKKDAIVARDSGFMTPVEDIWPDVPKDDFVGPAMGTSVIEGTMWSIPFNNSQILMYYNEDHFEDAGLDPNSPPDTLEELATAANTIVDEGVADYGVTWPNHNWWVHSWMGEQEAFVSDKENGRVGEPTEVYYNGDTARDLFDWWVNDLGDAYLNPGIKDWGAAEQAFQNGVSSMLMDSTGSIAYLLEGFRDSGINASVAPLPVPGERIGHNMGGAAVWVTDKDRSEAERDAIRKFLENMTGPEQQALYSRNTGYFPSHEESFTVLQEDNFYEDNPAYGVAYDQYEAWEEYAMNQGILMGPSAKVFKELERQTDNMLGGTAIDEGTQAAKDFGDRSLARYVRG